jgi:hypothetical protein
MLESGRWGTNVIWFLFRNYWIEGAVWIGALLGGEIGVQLSKYFHIRCCHSCMRSYVNEFWMPKYIHIKRQSTKYTFNRQWKSFIPNFSIENYLNVWVIFIPPPQNIFSLLLGSITFFLHLKQPAANSLFFKIYCSERQKWHIVKQFHVLLSNDTFYGIYNFYCWKWTQYVLLKNW